MTNFIILPYCPKYSYALSFCSILIKSDDKPIKYNKEFSYKIIDGLMIGKVC